MKIHSLVTVSALAIGVVFPAAAAEPVTPASFKTQGGFKAVEEMMQVGDKHAYSHGVAWGVVSGDGPVQMLTASCPYINELIGDTITFQGRCVWTDGDGDKIFTAWSAEFAASTGAGDGLQPITGGTGKFGSIQGAAPFHCQALNDKGQFVCSQQWNLTTK
jgi:hypothetical protein